MYIISHWSTSFRLFCGRNGNDISLAAQSEDKISELSPVTCGVTFVVSEMAIVWLIYINFVTIIKVIVRCRTVFQQNLIFILVWNCNLLFRRQLTPHAAELGKLFLEAKRARPRTGVNLLEP